MPSWCWRTAGFSCRRRVHATSVEQVRNGIARLDGITGLADAFNPNALTGSEIYAIVLQTDGRDFGERLTSQHWRPAAQQHRPA